MADLYVKLLFCIYKFDEGNGFGVFNKLYGLKSENSNNYFFNFPQLPLGCFIQYYIAVQDTGNTIVSSLPLGAKGFNPPGNIPRKSFIRFIIHLQQAFLLILLIIRTTGIYRKFRAYKFKICFGSIFYY
jgi:hypothetical protein